MLTTLLLAAGALTSTSTDADTIRQIRAASNAAIAAHDMAGAVRMMEPEARILGSSGGMADGLAAMQAAFGRSFADPAFVTYVRSTDTVRTFGDVGAETGHWRGIWRDRVVSGPYLARWKRADGAWRIVSEMYVPTDCAGAGCRP